MNRLPSRRFTGHVKHYFLWKIWKTCFENVVCQLWLALKELRVRFSCITSMCLSKPFRQGESNFYPQDMNGGMRSSLLWLTQFSLTRRSRCSQRRVFLQSDNVDSDHSTLICNLFWSFISRVCTWVYVLSSRLIQVSMIIQNMIWIYTNEETSYLNLPFAVYNCLKG